MSLSNLSSQPFTINSFLCVSFCLTHDALSNNAEQPCLCSILPHQFHDKIDPMMESLERMAERLRQPPSISVEVEKIREQISENKAVTMELEKLQPSFETLKQRGEEMIARSEGADKDISAKGERLASSECLSPRPTW